MRALLLIAVTLAAQELPDYDALRKTARTAYAKGDFAASRQALEQAWELVQQSPPDDPKRYEVLKQLSAVLSASGDSATAQKYVEMAIEWRQNIDRNDPKLADDYTELAAIVQRQKDYAKARELLGLSLRFHSRLNPPNVMMADDFSRIALVYMEEKKPTEATPPLETAIAIREQVLGAENPSILNELDRLGSIWLALREYGKAEDTFRRAMTIRERYLGPNDANLIQTVEGLAYAQFGQKKYAEAEPGYKRLLGLWAMSTGDPTHPMVAMTYDKMAVFYRAQDRWEEGTTAAENGNAMRAIFFAIGLSQEATARQAHGDKKEAARLFAKALDALDESRPEHQEFHKQLEQNLADLQIEVKPAKKKKQN